jgi:hypothetical protein
MSDFDKLRSYLETHHQALGSQLTEDFELEFSGLQDLWNEEEDQAFLINETLQVIGKYPSVMQTLRENGLATEEQASVTTPMPPTPAAKPGNAPSGAAQATVTEPVAPAAAQVAPPKGEVKMTENELSKATRNRLAIWDSKLAIGKEAVTGCLGILIVGVTLLVALLTIVLAFSKPDAWSPAKDILLILNGLVGVVLGYYFGRIPGEAQAAKAETVAEGARGEAEAARSELDQTKAEVRGMLTEATVATSRGAADEELELSPEQTRRLWELVNR